MKSELSQRGGETDGDLNYNVLGFPGACNPWNRDILSNAEAKIRFYINRFGGGIFDSFLIFLNTHSQ